MSFIACACWYPLPGCIVNKKWIVITAFLAGIVGGSLRAQTGFVTMSTVKARSLAMGGAFVSVMDDLAALDFNPAGFSVKTVQEGFRFSAFFNPLGPALMISHLDRVPVWDATLGWVLRGVTFKYGNVQFGILFGEENLGSRERLERPCLFDGEGYEEQRNTSFGISFAPAQRVSLGIAGEIFFRRNDQGEMYHGLGYRYGVIIKPGQAVNVGICYVDFPEAYQSDRRSLERLADETLNVGMTYAPWQRLLLSLDFRNVSDEGKGASLEPHVGFEVIAWRHTALRGGFFRNVDENVNTVSLGIGLFDWNLLFSKYLRYAHSTFLMNSTLVFELEGLRRRWFLLSMVLRV